MISDDRAGLKPAPTIRIGRHRFFRKALADRRPRDARPDIDNLKWSGTPSGGWGLVRETPERGPSPGSRGRDPSHPGIQEQVRPVACVAPINAPPIEPVVRPPDPATPAPAHRRATARVPFDHAARRPVLGRSASRLGPTSPLILADMRRHHDPCSKVLMCGATKTISRRARPRRVGLPRAQTSSPQGQTRRETGTQSHGPATPPGAAGRQVAGVMDGSSPERRPASTGDVPTRSGPHGLPARHTAMPRPQPAERSPRRMAAHSAPAETGVTYGAASTAAPPGSARPPTVRTSLSA